MTSMQYIRKITIFTMSIFSQYKRSIFYFIEFMIAIPDLYTAIHIIL